MPTYGYECTACAHQFETFQSIKDDALTTCDACGGNLRKRVYPVGIAFKGSGFYVNDYAPKSGGTVKTDAPASDAKPADTKAEAKPDTAKPADTPIPAKTETKADAPKTSMPSA